jgi:hypothetical protein
MPVTSQFQHHAICLSLRSDRGGWRFKRWAQGLVLGVGAMLCLSSPGAAAERIVLKLETTEVTIPVSTLNTFVRTGEVSGPELQEFFQRRPRVQQILRDTLGKEINISRVSADRFFQTSTGEFVLTQIQRLVTTPAAGAGLEALRQSLLASYKDDNRFSLLEVVNNFPAPEIRLDVSVVERVYDDVSAFVERIQPALEAVRGVLQDFICDCEKRSAIEGTPISAETAQLKELAFGEAARQECAKHPLATRSPQSLASEIAP